MAVLPTLLRTILSSNTIRKRSHKRMTIYQEKEVFMHTRESWKSQVVLTNRADCLSFTLVTPGVSCVFLSPFWWNILYIFSSVFPRSVRLPTLFRAYVDSPGVCRLTNRHSVLDSSTPQYSCSSSFLGLRWSAWGVIVKCKQLFENRAAHLAVHFNKTAEDDHGWTLDFSFLSVFNCSYAWIHLQ